MTLSADEVQRVVAVHRLRLLGTPAEERFDRITRLACRIFGVPVAAVELAGEGRVWLKSAIGIDRLEMRRETPDATLPLGDHSAVQIYADLPLHLHGSSVGTFYIGGPAPRRELTPEEQASLREMAQLVEAELGVEHLSEAQMVVAARAQELRERALVDPLTRMWNQAGIREVIAEEIPFKPAVAMLDIDDFDSMSDVHGVPIGDAVLREVAARLRAHVRPLDAVGRYDGDVFVVVLPTCLEPTTVITRLCALIAETPIQTPAGEQMVTISAGVTSSSTGSTVDDLIARADAALYDAKLDTMRRVHFR